jgi:hypothetical protein
MHSTTAPLLLAMLVLCALIATAAPIEPQRPQTCTGFTIQPAAEQASAAPSTLSAAAHLQKRAGTNKACSVVFLLDPFYLGTFGTQDPAVAFEKGKEELYAVTRTVNEVFMRHFGVGLAVEKVLYLII